MSPRGALLCTALVLAVGLRVAPLLLSPLPYNVDGFALARDAGAAQDGVLPAVSPFPALLLAQAAAICDVSPLLLAQAVWAVVGSVVSLAILAWASRRGLSPAGGVAVAVLGLALYATMTVTRQAVGLALLAAAIAVEAVAWPVALALLLLLPAFHHLTSVVAGVALVTRGALRGRPGEIGLGGALAAAGVYVAFLDRSATPLPLPLVAGALLLATGLIWVMRSLRWGRWIAGIAVAASAGLVLLTVLRLDGWAATPPLFLVALPAYAVVAYHAARALDSPSARTAALPLALAALGVSAIGAVAQGPDGYVLARRGLDFIVLPIGLALAAVAPRAATMAVVLAATTVFVPFAGPGALGFESVTSTAELAAIEAAATVPGACIHTDSKLGQVTEQWSRRLSCGDGPSQLGRGGPVLARAVWETAGAPSYPSGWQEVPDFALRREGAAVIYDVGVGFVALGGLPSPR